MSSYSDISGMENLRQMSQSVKPSSMKTYIEQRAHETQDQVADVITGLGNELMGHASIKTLEHLGKARKIVKDAARKKLDEVAGKVSDEVSDIAARAQDAMDAARDSVRGAVRDTIQVSDDLADRVRDPFGGGRIVLNDDGTARIAAATDPDVEGDAARPAQPDPAEDIRPAPAEPQAVQPEAPEIAGDNLGSDVAKGTEQLAEKAAVKVGEKAGEDAAEQSLKGAFLTSLGEDESPFGVAATAALGIATLIAGVVSHHHEHPPVAITHYRNTQPINYNYQSGL